MFNSGVIDVAIGMIFVYLILSLITSAANEVIELRLKNRASDLEKGIRQLLEPGLKAGEAKLVEQLYNHPLVNGLFGGTYAQSGIGEKAGVPQDKDGNPKKESASIKLGRVFKSTNLPSYIPSANFALALMDLAVNGKLAHDEAGASSPPTSPDSPPVAPLQSPPDSVGFSVHALREALARNDSIIPPTTRRGLLTLLDAAQNDATKARENIESWFNSSMDRVSGWYKRRSQIIVLVLGFLVAFAVNADSVLIAKRLVADKSLRESLAVAADEYAKANANASSTSGIKEEKSGKATPQATPTPKTKCYPVPEECKANPGSPQCKLDKSLCDIEALGLPIGWNYQDDPQRRWPGLNFNSIDGWLAQFYWHFLGWVITALAISLGAPFWFDLLNKFIVVRSTVKPHEKSREESPK